MRLVQVHFCNLGTFFAVWVTFSNSKVEKNFGIILKFGPLAKHNVGTQNLRLGNVFQL
jgi:hypothetical protein